MTYVLIPGAGGSAWYWHRVEAELRDRGHSAIAVELPAADEGAGIPEYADAVVRAVGDRTDIILVAQSMGGFTAVPVCERIPVRLLVFVNAMIPMPGETPADWWESTGQDAARRANDLRDGRVPDAPFDPRTYFFHDVPPALADFALSVALPQSDTPFGSRLPPDPLPSVPKRVIVGRDDRFFPAEFQRRVAQERLGITPDEIPGGHLVALSYPTELVGRLEAYVAELTLRA